MTDKRKAAALAFYLLGILAGGLAFLFAYVAVQSLMEWSPLRTEH